DAVAGRLELAKIASVLGRWRSRQQIPGYLPGVPGIRRVVIADPVASGMPNSRGQSLLPGLGAWAVPAQDEAQDEPRVMEGDDGLGSFAARLLYDQRVEIGVERMDEVGRDVLEEFSSVYSPQLCQEPPRTSDLADYARELGLDVQRRIEDRDLLRGPPDR